VFLLLKENGLGFQKRKRFHTFTLSKAMKAAESGFVILLMWALEEVVITQVKYKSPLTLHIRLCTKFKIQIELSPKESSMSSSRRGAVTSESTSVSGPAVRSSLEAIEES
jgi:hypothetical protein